MSNTVTIKVNREDLDVLTQALFDLKNDRVKMLETADTKEFVAELVEDIQTASRLWNLATDAEENS